jgi:hypothetical protein
MGQLALHAWEMTAFDQVLMSIQLAYTAGYLVLFFEMYI